MDHHNFKPSESTNHINTSNFFHYLMSNSDSAAIFLLDAKGIVIDINVGVTRSFGYSKEDVIGKFFSFLFIPEDRDKNLPEMEILTVHQKGVAKDNNYIVHKDGSQVWVHGESIFVKESEEEIFIIKILYDINSQKLLEKFLIQSNQQLRRLNKDRDNFVYAASHDLQGPINNLKGLFEMLFKLMPDNIENSIKINELKGHISTSINRFYKILEDLTKIGIEADGAQLEEVEFKSILEEIKLDLLPLLNDSGGVIEDEFSRVPNILFSRKNLRSIIYNLVSNALKYKSPERSPKVRLKTGIADNSIILTVEDNGTGIEEMDKDKVFALGKRLTDQVEGSGIGMALVKRIIDNSEGKIEIESQVGKGSIFKVYLPKQD